MNFLGIFRAQNDRLVIGYLMGAEIFEFRPNFGPWQLFKEGNRQGVTPYLKQEDLIDKAGLLYLSIVLRASAIITRNYISCI